VRPCRIEIGPATGIDDPRGASVVRQGQHLLGLPITSIRTHTLFKLDMELDDRELADVCRAISDPILEQASTRRMPPLTHVNWIVAVGLCPGVTDNLGSTARVFVADVLERELPDNARVFTETLYFVQGLQRAEVERLARELLANELIQRITIWDTDEYRASEVDLRLPLAGESRNTTPTAVPIPLPDDDEALLRLSRERTLSLDLAELRAIRDHHLQPDVQLRRSSIGLPPDAPTDVELEALAQTWSEHCKHKIFNARIRYREHPDAEPELITSLFRTYIVDVTRELASSLDWLVSVFDDNAGVVRFDAETNLVYKVETHNSPSALDPYGGAITGIVGVNRDPMGTGMGAALLTNVWGYCLASPSHDGPLPRGLLHPRRIRDGVHHGVIDGGNQSGIPYSRGFELFDPRYLGKPLVFCGTVGTMPGALPDGRPSHVKAIEPDDLVVMVGGRIGKDGIHGATFSSEALHGKSPAQAVQIGDPITQKKMRDMLLEARDAGLYRAVTDNGAGGLSSSVGELAQLCGGAELDLDRAPLKYAGLQPWEILLSEAQERMTLAVPPDRVEALLDLARRREVEATVVGRFTRERTFRLRYRGQVVGDLAMDFMHDGCPVLELEATHRPTTPVTPDLAGDAADLLGQLLASLNLCSKEARWRQYDHEVKGLSVIKPLTGVHGDVPADCTSMRVDHRRPGAVLLAEGIAPWISDLDAEAMATWVVDLAVRRIVAGGGQLGQIAGLDNFCWPDPVRSPANPDGDHKLAQLVRACRGLASMTRGLKVPCISGKDSMKNDSVRGGVRISVPPTLLFSTLGWVHSVDRVLDLTPRLNDRIYLVGQTRPQLGASRLLALLGLQGGAPPRITAEETRTVCHALESAVDRGLVSAAHAPHMGGLGIGLAMLALASDLGLVADLQHVPGATPSDADLELLFSESGSRLLIGVAPSAVADFERLMQQQTAPWAAIGQVVTDPYLELRRGDRVLLRTEVARLRRRHKETLDEL